MKAVARKGVVIDASASAASGALTKAVASEGMAPSAEANSRHCSQAGSCPGAESWCSDASREGVCAPRHGAGTPHPSRGWQRCKTRQGTGGDGA